MTHEEDFTVPLGGGTLTLTGREAIELRAFVRGGHGYGVLRKVLVAINEAAKAEACSPESDLDKIRIAQGKIQGVAEVSRVCEVDLERWYEEGKSNTDDEETA